MTVEKGQDQFLWMESLLLNRCPPNSDLQAGEDVKDVFLSMKGARSMMRSTSRGMNMTATVASKAKADARAKLTRLQSSSTYRSFYNQEAVEAFAKVEGTAFAGKPLKSTGDMPSSS